MPRSNAIAVSPGDPSTLQRITLDIPEPSATEVLIDVIRCGVCGTDREIAAGHIGRPPEGSEAIVLGHEMLGRVRDAGAEVTGVKPGDLVTATVRRPDGCPLCQAGHPDMCLWNDYTERGIKSRHGYLCQHVVVDERWVIRVPESLEPGGVLLEPLSVVAKAVRQTFLVQKRLPIWEPKTAVVLGAGPIGILATLVLRSMDIDVFTVARTPPPNNAATAVERAGARYVSTRERSLDQLRADIAPIDIVVECTGAAVMSHEAIPLPGKNGVVALLSVSGAGREISVPADALNRSAVLGNVLVFGSVNAGREDWDEAVSYLQRFEERWPGLAESLITTRIPFDGDIGAILSDDKHGDIKTVVEF